MDRFMIVSTILIGMIIFSGIGYFVFDFRTNRNKVITNGRVLLIIMLSAGMALIGYLCMAISNHYSIDSFNLVFDMGPYWHLQLGRYLNCGIILLAMKLGLNQVLQQQFFCFVWLAALIAVISIVSIAISKYLQIQRTRTCVMIVLATSIAFVNVFMMEFVLFPEMMMVSAWGIISLGLSIYFALNVNMSMKSRALSVIYLWIALGNYQSYIGIFVSFVLIGNFLRWRENSVQCYKEMFLSLIYGGIVSASNIILVKFLINIDVITDSGRGTGLDLFTIKRNIIQLLKYQKPFWNNADGLLPFGVMPAIGIVLFGLLFYRLMYMKRWERSYVVISLCISYILGFAPHIVESTILLSPRSNVAIWSFFSGIFIFIITLNKWENIKKYRIITALCLILLLGSSTFYMQDMAANTQMVNAIDFTEADQICDRIKRYEINSGNTITQIAIKNDSNVTIYPHISKYKNCELGARILSTPYSGYRLLGYMLRRPLKKIDMQKDIYQKFFEGKDWNCLNVDEQMVFERDTLYLMIY